jgi:hypothetical protein
MDLAFPWFPGGGREWQRVSEAYGGCCAVLRSRKGLGYRLASHWAGNLTPGGLLKRLRLITL